MDADLLKTCPECMGEGMVQDPEWAAWFDEYGDTQYRLRQKAEAKGGGRDSLTDEERERLTEAEDAMPPTSRPEEVECPSCLGHGKIPTEKGEEVLELCAHWLEVQQPDARWKGWVVVKG